jgi:hypothetical protein
MKRLRLINAMVGHYPVDQRWHSDFFVKKYRTHLILIEEGVTAYVREKGHISGAV